MSSSSPRENGADSTVVVGLVRSPNGLNGDVHVELLSDVPGRFSEGRQVLIGNSTFTILRVRQQAKHLIVRFNDVGSREEAEKLRNSYISIDIDQVPQPPPDTYYHYQLLDMQVFEKDGTYLGILTQILQTGANDAYVIKGPKREIVLPAIANVIIGVNTEKGVMQVDLPEGI
tara:strand:- start:631 stop:1149 length:519 start_codon:yes stop_codon:yes gene_type:complete